MKYLRYESGNAARHLPMVHAVLTNDDVVLPTAVLVDSGSTSTFIPSCMAQLLKLDLGEKNDDVTGAGGSFAPHITKIEKIDMVKNHKIFVSFENQIIRVPEQENVDAFCNPGQGFSFSQVGHKI